MSHFCLSRIAHMLGQEVPHDIALTGFKQDNRLVSEGDLFFAFKGKKTDGHDFLEDVALRGGRAAVVSREYAGKDFGLVLLRVDDVLEALHFLAREVQAARSMRVIAVTGSVGKTTTKEFIASLLEGHFKVVKTLGNANSQVSVPLSILNTSQGDGIFVIEMGMTEKGEMQRLIDIAPPEMAIVTNISLAHVLFFSDGIDGIAREKAVIFSHPKTRLGIVSAQAMQFAAVAHTGTCPKVVYGEKDFYLQEGEEVRIVEKGICSPPIPLGFEASHLKENFLAASLVARTLGMTWEDIAEKAPKLTAFSKRFERVVQGGIVFINDSYNANATSMKAALKNLPRPESGKKTVAVLGGMKELGAYTMQLHKEVGECALECVDQLICLGEECQVMVDLFSHQGKPAELHFDFAAVKKRLFETVEAGDVVLIKGSRPWQLWRLLE